MTLAPKILLRLWLVLSVNFKICQLVGGPHIVGPHVYGDHLHHIGGSPLVLHVPNWATCGVQDSKDILVLEAEIDLVRVKADLEDQDIDDIIFPVMNHSTSINFLFQNNFTGQYNVLCMQFVGITTKVQQHTALGCRMTEYVPNKVYKIVLNQVARSALSEVKVKVAWKQEDYDNEYAYESDTIVTFPKIFMAYNASLTIGTVTKEGRVPSDYMMEFHLDMTEVQANTHGGGSLKKRFCVDNLIEPFTLSATLYERSLGTLNDPYDPTFSTAGKSVTNQDCLDLTEWQLKIPTMVFILTLKEEAACGRSATFEHIIQHSQSAAQPSAMFAGDVIITLAIACIAYASL